ncbi:MAG: methyltransferase [Bacteroidota bacterium]|nr:methyltransferase [Bacteroidota bacterium]
MPNQWFRFKEFTVWQNKTAMKVGTDGVLLGAWANCAGAKSVLDVGTGTGLISLMLVQRFPDISVLAIDIDEDTIEQAQDNFDASPWKNRLSPKNISFQELAVSHKHKFDHIVSNPPYFENSLHAPDKKRNIARHNVNLSIDELINSASILLNKNGKLSVILPDNSIHGFLEKSKKKHLYCTRKLLLKPKKNKSVLRVLLELSFNKVLVETDTLVIENEKRHDYTEAYKDLTKGFYIKF